MRKHYGDMSGQKIGRWTVLKRVPSPEYYSTHQVYYLARCECGTEKVVPAGNLRSGNSKSCGCLQKEILREKRAGYRSARREEA